MKILMNDLYCYFIHTYISLISSTKGRDILDYRFKISTSQLILIQKIYNLHLEMRI